MHAGDHSFASRKSTDWRAFQAQRRQHRNHPLLRAGSRCWPHRRPVRPAAAASLLCTTANQAGPRGDLLPIGAFSGPSWRSTGSCFWSKSAQDSLPVRHPCRRTPPDFFGDATNYATSLMVVGMALRYRASVALAKGATNGVFGLWVVGAIIWHLMHGTLPSAFTMGAVGFAARLANAASFGLLWAYRGATPICGRLGFARRTMFSATSPCCSPLWACSALAQAGRTLSSPRSWPLSRCKAPRLSSGKR